MDALIGYSLTGAPRGGTADLIRAANEHPAPVLALDVPSGIDSTTGELYLADIGVPPELYARPSLGLEVGPVFARDEVFRLR